MSSTFQLYFAPFHKEKNLNHLARDSFWNSGEVVFLRKSLVAKHLLLVGCLFSEMFHLGYPLLSTRSDFAVAFAIGSPLESLLVGKFTKHVYKLMLVVISLLHSTFCFFCVWKFSPYFGSEKHISQCLFTSVVILWFRCR